jgi:hypothetical protein
VGCERKGGDGGEGGEGTSYGSFTAWTIDRRTSTFVEMADLASGRAVLYMQDAWWYPPVQSQDSAKPSGRESEWLKKKLSKERMRLAAGVVGLTR